MSFNWMRRALLSAAAASALLLAACGSGSIESQLQPTRIVSFGDGFSDLGQTGSRNTVNDGTVNIWAQHVATSFAMSLDNAATGGLSYATRNARVNAKPDAVGNSATPTVKEQVDAFLAASTIGPDDLLLVSGGTSDLIAQMALVRSGAQTSGQMVANLRQAGRDLAAQVRRLVQAGGAHVVVVGPYNLGKTPWAASVGQVDFLADGSTAFNEELLVALVDLGANVLYVDAALLFNLMANSPGNYGFDTSADFVCTSVDPGPGIGIGTGQVNSALCTPSTVRAGVKYNAFLFADPVYPTPQGHLKFGEYAYSRIRERW
jgi:outer membrane lipase/esterase